jgi:hypothetical protein
MIAIKIESLFADLKLTLSDSKIHTDKVTIVYNPCAENTPTWLTARSMTSRFVSYGAGKGSWDLNTDAALFTVRLSSE